MASYADQLSITGSSIEPSTSSTDFNWNILGDVATQAIGTAGQVATSVWGYHQPPITQPYGFGIGQYGYGAQYPLGSTFGGIDSKILLIAAVGVVAILAFSKKS